jgi:uncharacterized protein with ATP-grasp and redox domains
MGGGGRCNLKVEAECLPCLFERGYRASTHATKDGELLLQIMRKLLDMMSEKYESNAVPAYLGTLRDRIIKEMVRKDPYMELKRESNRRALKILPIAEKYISEAKTGRERFRRACLVSIVANSIEFDILGHNFKFKDLQKFTKEKLAVDDTYKTFRILKKSKKVLFLTDNAGEIALDKLLINQLRGLELKVTVAVKEKPVLNDALIKDALEVGIDKVADELITTGTDTVGFILNEASKTARERFFESDLIFAKGMGNYETLTEEEGCGKKILFLLRAKCNPIARSVGVERESNVALLREL